MHLYTGNWLGNVGTSLFDARTIRHRRVTQAATALISHGVRKAYDWLGASDADVERERTDPRIYKPGRYYPRRYPSRMPRWSKGYAAQWGPRRRFYKRRRGGIGSQRRYGRRMRRTGGYSNMLASLPTEKKFSDSESNSDVFALTWAPMENATMLCLNAVAVGNTESTRVGRVYYIHGIFIRGEIVLSAIEASGVPRDDTLVRIVVVWDHQTNGAQLTATDVMDNTQTFDHLTFRKLQHTSRFTVLMDKVIVMKPLAVAQGAVDLFAAGAPRRSWRFNKVFRKPVKVTCKGTSAVVASITDNSFHVIGVSSQTNAVMSYQVRIRFTD